jgi:hypothetical protein
MSPRILLVVGLQKSGTSLLNRLLEKCSITFQIDRSEGNAFWGNEPPFSPSAYPCGELYLRHGGNNGHELSERDSFPHIQKILKSRLPNTDHPILLNKNPYNTLRLRWIRTIFPDAFIVAMIRQPLPNVFSLSKKYFDHSKRGIPPDEGWWGVKPNGWRTLVYEDKVIQSAYQWDAVNRKLFDDKDLVDYFLTYESLCKKPQYHIEEILSMTIGTRFCVDFKIPTLECYNFEYLRGSQLQSKNRLYKKFGLIGGKLPIQEKIEIAALDTEKITNIQKICNDTQNKFESLL